jgi:hypothetical protein
MDPLLKHKGKRNQLVLIPFPPSVYVILTAQDKNLLQFGTVNQRQS